MPSLKLRARIQSVCPNNWVDANQGFDTDHELEGFRGRANEVEGFSAAGEASNVSSVVKIWMRESVMPTAMITSSIDNSIFVVNQKSSLLCTEAINLNLHCVSGSLDKAISRGILLLKVSGDPFSISAPVVDMI